MSNYFDELESELRAAVPRAARGRRREIFGAMGRISLTARRGLAPAAAIAIALAVAGLAVVLLGRHVASQRSAAPPSRLGSLAQLTASFAILRRPQSPADRRCGAACSSVGIPRPATSLTRLARVLPGGARVYLSVARLRRSALGLPARAYLLTVTVVDPPGPAQRGYFAPSSHYDVLGITGAGVQVGIVPDGVGRVFWSFGCDPHRACTGQAPSGAELTWRANVVVRALKPSPPGWGLQLAEWYGPGGALVARFRRHGVLPTTPPPRSASP